MTVDKGGLRFEANGAAGRGEFFFPVYVDEEAGHGLFFSQRHVDRRSAKIVAKKSALSLLSIPHLIKISKAGMVADEVCLRLSSDLPCVVRVSMSFHLLLTY